MIDKNILEKFPKIDLLSREIKRPFWSVMIPTYNCADYLEHTLKSVLEQAPSSEEMQIEVVDDGSTKDDPEAVVRKIGGGRVSFYQQAQNVGFANNLNTCIQRASGHWLHILNGDDIVLPGFYKQLRNGIEKESSVGAAFCRHYYINDNYEILVKSRLERETPGILDNWLARIAVPNPIQTASIVVRRSVYETLGGFCPDLFYATDWEMWVRIATQYQFWYEPEFLACWRVQPNSLTSNMRKTGGDKADLRKAMQICESYLPKNIAIDAGARGRERWAIFAVDNAHTMLLKEEIDGAIAQIREALKLCVNPRIVRSLVELFLSPDLASYSAPPLTLNPHREIPKIYPVSGDVKRPFWSVMIPTYNCAKFLEKTLASVLAQDPGPDFMQIEVVDDGSTEDDPEAVVKKMGQGRVSFYRQPQNVGQCKNWNTCIERAQGHWIHILHGDDIVLPGFYQQLQPGIEQNPMIGAAFCRFATIDEAGSTQSLGPIERPTAGILENWLERIAIPCPIQTPTIVVKRKVYEQLGGFEPELKAGNDWEMWARIAVHYPFWYEPKVLACYRQHTSSITGHLKRSGANLIHIRCALEIVESYLPKSITEKTSVKARDAWGYGGINTAKEMLEKGEKRSAITQVREALRLSDSDVVIEALLSLFADPNFSELIPVIVENIQGYLSNPSQGTALQNLRQIRQQIARQWLGQDPQELENSYKNALGEAHKLLCNSPIKYEPLTTSESYFVNQLLSQVQAGFKSPNGIQSFLAAILYCQAYQLPLPYRNAAVPTWLFQDFITYLLQPVLYFHSPTEIRQYNEYIQDLIEYLHENILQTKKIDFWRYVSKIFTETYQNNLLYLLDENLNKIHQKIAQIIEFYLQPQSRNFEPHLPNHEFQVSLTRKIRIGILVKNFGVGKETAIALPFFESFDLEKFEIFLYALEVNAQPLELYCQRHAQRLLHLPENLQDQVSMIRADQLDILLFNSHLTEPTNPITLLAHHRLARIQIANLLTPISSGIGNIDYYLAGKLTTPLPAVQSDFSEKLINLEGSGLCFSFPVESQARTVQPDRESWGATAESVVFISGANFKKMTPALRATWIKILQGVPKAVLVLYPFGQHPHDSYPHRVFYHQLRSQFVEGSLSPSQLVIINSLPSRADIKACLEQADIYLDAYPYTGAASMIDPLEVGIVPIVRVGDALHTRQAAALLRELQLEYLITDSEAAYIQRAIAIATNPQLRQQLQQQIQSQMQSQPRFLKRHAYGAKIQAVFTQLVATQHPDNLLD